MNSLRLVTLRQLVTIVLCAALGGGDAGACIPVDAKLQVELDLTGAAPGGHARLTHRAKPDTP